MERSNRFHTLLTLNIIKILYIKCIDLYIWYEGKTSDGDPHIYYMRVRGNFLLVSIILQSKK